MNDFLENIIGLGSPDEEFRILLCMATCSLDSGEQIELLRKKLLTHQSVRSQALH
jgi:hypothetical protein